MLESSTWLRRRGRPTRGLLILTVTLGEVAGVLFLAQTALLARVVDGAIFAGSPAALLRPELYAVLALIAARALTVWGSRRAGHSCASRVKTRLRADIVEHLRRVGPIKLAGLQAGRLAHTTVDAVEALEAYFSRYLPQRSIASLLPLTMLAVLVPLDRISGLILLVTALFLPLSMIAIGQESHERNRKLWGALSRMSGRFLDVLQGLATVRMFDAAGREAREIERTSGEYRVLTLSVLRIAFLSSFMLELVSTLSIAIVAVVSGFRLLDGTMSFYPAYFVLLVAPEYFLTLRQLGTLYHTRMEAVSAAEQIRELEDTPAVIPAAGRARPRVGPAAVVFRDVSFGYGERRILTGASFRLDPGERLTLAGPSGAGKSTILALLLGFARPDAGTVEVDGHPVDHLDPEHWHARVAWLPQRPTMFHGSLGDNILLGREAATQAELEEALHLAHVDEFLPRMPDGLRTLIGEGGRGLSVGQAQRVALARLFLRRPGLVLLDEPTAHLDAGSAALVSQALEKLCAGRTTILVTHRSGVAAEGHRLWLRDGRLEGAP